jgi:predicted nucleic acid-binding protein
MGTIGILEAGAARGLVDLRAVLDRLRTTNFRMDPQAVRDALDRDRARRHA